MRYLMLLAIGLATLFIINCDGDDPPDGDGDSDSDGDTDIDGDGDGDSDSDGDSDGDSDSDGDGDLGPCPSGVDCLDERNTIFELLNEDRAEYCPDNPLVRDPRLDEVAMLRTVAMADQSTTAPTGVAMLRDRLVAQNFDLSMTYEAGENVGSHTSISGMQQMFWDYEDPEDPGTFPMQDRIINCECVMVGIGIAANIEGRYYGTQTFLIP